MRLTRQPRAPHNLLSLVSPHNQPGSHHNNQPGLLRIDSKTLPCFHQTISKSGTTSSFRESRRLLRFRFRLLPLPQQHLIRLPGRRPCPRRGHSRSKRHLLPGMPLQQPIRMHSFLQHHLHQ